MLSWEYYYRKIMDTKVFVKSEEEIQSMRESCQMLAQVVESLTPLVKAGARSGDIDAFAEAEIRAKGCVPAFKGYGDPELPFPATICFSVNEGVVHGIPGDYVIKEGDVVKVDIGLIHKEHYSDMARTFVVGNASADAYKIRDVAKGSFEAGLAALKDGATLHDWAEAADAFAREHGCSQVRNLVGHGIGRELHMAPQIPNYVDQGFENFTFRAGMTVALEPMVNIGSADVDLGADGWVYETTDGSLSGHWENTVLITENGAEILTKP